MKDLQQKIKGICANYGNDRTRMMDIVRDKVQGSYWLHVRYEKSGIESLVLFDPHELVVLRHIIINEKGHDEVDVVYENYQPGLVNEKQAEENWQAEIDNVDSRGTLCRMPTKIRIVSNSGAEKKIDLKLFSFIPDAHFSQDDFELEVPDNLEELIVN